jgi:hypothetical protein
MDTDVENKALTGLQAGTNLVQDAGFWHSFGARAMSHARFCSYAEAQACRGEPRGRTAGAYA